MKYRTCYDNGKYDQCIYGLKANTYELGHLFYGVVPIGVEVRGSIGNKYTYRVRRGNGYYNAIHGKHYQDKYKYFVPSSISNAESEPYRRQWIEAVQKWKFDLSAPQKAEYNRRADLGLHMSGYNLFIREAMKGLVQMFVDRGDPAAYDFTSTDFTDDGTWRTLGLTSIITTSAKAVLFDIDFKSANAFKHIQLRRYDNSNEFNHFDTMTIVGNQEKHAMAIVSVDNNRLIQYNIESATWTELNMTVRGWWT